MSNLIPVNNYTCLMNIFILLDLDSYKYSVSLI